MLIDKALRPISHHYANDSGSEVSTYPERVSLSDSTQPYLRMTQNCKRQWSTSAVYDVVPTDWVHYVLFYSELGTGLHVSEYFGVRCWLCPLQVDWEKPKDRFHLA